jgi:hypothetical protein
MTDFAHVTNLTLRRVLMRQEGGDAVADALAFTSDCLLRDASDKEIPYHIVDARQEALDEASGWWNDEGNEWEAVEALRRCWSV